MGYSSRARKALALLLLLSVACLLAAPVIEAAAANPPGWFLMEPGADRQFLSMSAGDRNTVWAVSYDYKLFKSEDGGAHWGIENPVTDLYRVLDVSAVNGSVAWVLGFWGDSTGYFLNLTRTSDGGATWSTGADMGLPSGYAPIYPEIESLDSETAWVCFTLSPVMWPPDYHSAIIKTTDGGDTWEGQYGGSGPTADVIIRDLSAVSTDTAWAVQGNRALRTTGSGWAQFSIPGIPGGAIASSISAADADTAWVSGYDGNIIKTTDGGQSWLTQYSDTSQSIGTLTAIDSNNVWACGGCTTGQLMLKTTDGNTWMTQSLPSVGALRDMCAVDVNTAWTVSYDTRILRTTDGGSGQPMPYVASVTPGHGQPWAEVTVSGSGFRESRPPLSNVNFGPVAALEYTSWSDTEISCRVPSTLEPGEVPLSVTTLFWTSNEVPFTVEPATVKVTSITPASGVENTVVDITDLLGAGFQEGAAVRIEKGSSVISATEVTVVSDTTITCRLNLAGAAPGRYAVIVTNPDASEGRLQEAFLVSGICGEGAGVSLGAFCCLMGVLSLAGSGALLTGLRKLAK